MDDVGGALAARPGALRNPLLADTYERLARSAGASREARIDAARDAWYRGWVAEAMARRLRRTLRERARRPGARTAAHESRSRCRCDFGGWTVFKTGPWGQGPVFLQQLALLDG